MTVHWEEAGRRMTAAEAAAAAWYRQWFGNQDASEGRS